MLTITQAAERAKVSRAAIHKAIKAGRISWTKDDKDHYLIDPSELDRVYQPIDEKNTDFINPIEHQLLAQKLDFTERLLWQTENERDRLVQIIAMLGHQPENKPEPVEEPEYQPEIKAEPVEEPEQQPVTSLLWQKLFGRHGPRSTDK
jgi:excisionase family DNA binding protein